MRGGAWVGLLVNERTVTAGKGEAEGEWRGGGGVCCVFVRVGGGGGGGAKNKEYLNRRVWKLECEKRAGIAQW